MSHFETIKFSTAIIRITLISVFVFNSPVNAADKCELLFKPTLTENLKKSLSNLRPSKLFSHQSRLELSPTQIDDLKKFFNSDLNIRPHGMRRGTDEPLFMYIWSQIPETNKATLTELLKNSLKEFKKFRILITDVLSQHQIDSGTQDTYFDLLLTNWGEYLKSSSSPMSFENWIEKLQQQYTQQVNTGEIRLQELKIKFEAGVQFRNAKKYWQSELGVHELPVKFENAQNFVMLNGHRLKCRIDRNKKTIRILAPREMVGRAAWNPIYTEVLQKKLSSGQKNLAQYPAFIATNGVFYLSDGNHRFILDDRPEVWLEMSYPAKTSSMSISFDAIGLQQPSVENLVKLQSKEVTLEDLIGEAFAAKIIYR